MTRPVIDQGMTAPPDAVIPVPVAGGTAATGLTSQTGRARTRTTGHLPWWVLPARLLLIVVVLASWEFSSGRWVDDFFVSRPSAIGPVFWGWLLDGTLLEAAASTFYSAAVGFLIGTVVAIIAGYALGVSAKLAAVVEPFITAVYSLPKVALVPLFILWFGIGRELQFLVCALIVFFLMFYNIYFGVREVDQQLIDAVRIMGGRRRHIALSVRIPSAMVWVVAGMKISVPQAIVGVVFAEILASNAGLGHLLAVNAGVFNSAGTFAALFALLIVGVSMERLSSLITRRALRWKQDLNSGPGRS